MDASERFGTTRTQLAVGNPVETVVPACRHLCLLRKATQLTSKTAQTMVPTVDVMHYWRDVCQRG